MDRSSAPGIFTKTPVQHASNVLELSAAFAFVLRDCVYPMPRFVAACLLAGVHPPSFRFRTLHSAEAESVHRATVGRVRKRLIDNGLTFSAHTQSALVARLLRRSFPGRCRCRVNFWPMFYVLWSICRVARSLRSTWLVLRKRDLYCAGRWCCCAKRVSGTAAPCVEGGRWCIGLRVWKVQTM